MRETTQFKLWRYLVPFRLKFFRKRFAGRKSGCWTSAVAFNGMRSATVPRRQLMPAVVLVGVVSMKGELVRGMAPSAG